MLAYIARRLILAGFTVWSISLLAWFIIQLPEGDLVDEYFEALMQESLSGPAGEERTEAMRKYLGMDQPLIVQYAKWIWGLMQGDLGRSFAGSFAGGANTRAEDQPIKPLIGDRLLLTVVLTGFTIVVTWTFAIPVGIYSAVRQHSVGDYVFTFIGFSGLAVPDFLLGLVLMYVAFAYFDVSVGGLFSGDYQNAPWSMARVMDLLDHLWIPAVVLGTSGDGGPDPHHEKQPAGRASQTLCRDRAGKGSGLVQGNREVPGQGSHQPVDQHGWVPAAGARKRQRDRVGRAEPADDWTAAAGRDSEPGTHTWRASSS